MNPFENVEIRHGERRHYCEHLEDAVAARTAELRAATEHAESAGVQKANSWPA